jgi:CheY-like chemotaxis protein
MIAALQNSPLLQIYARVYFAVRQHRVLIKPVVRIFTAIIGKKPLNVVLTDDDTDDCEIFLEAMKNIAPQVKVTVCEDGNDLMNYLFKKDVTLPDIIFLDLNMPLKGGHECLKEIRANEALKGIPVIIYSTSTNKDHIEKTFKNGANFYFPKPNSFKDLTAIMEKIFNFNWSEFMKPQKSKFVLSINRLNN